MHPTDTDPIVLHGVEGIVRKFGTDAHGNVWIQFEVDFFADQNLGECSICGASLASGWQCLDGGDEVCDSHIEYEGES